MVVHENRIIICTVYRYYLRFMDPRNSKELVNKEKERSGAYTIVQYFQGLFVRKYLIDYVFCVKEPYKKNVVKDPL